MKPIIIIGASGFAKEIYLIIRDLNRSEKRWDFRGFVDIEGVGMEVIDGYKIIGDDDYALTNCNGFAAVVAQGFPDKKKRIHELYKQQGSFEFPNLIHPSVMGDFNNIKMGEGNIIFPGCILTSSIVLGNANVINMGCLVAHDVTVGDFCVINPGVKISGNVSIESECLIGSGSVIYQGVRIRARSTLGLGSVLTRGTEEGATYLGNPAKKIM